MIKLILIFSVCVAATSEVKADIAVVVNSNNTTNWLVDNIQNEIKSIFLGVKEKFLDGNAAKPIDQIEGKQIRKDFYLKITNKDETAMNVYWSKLIFTGNGRPPKVIGDDSAVKKFINENVTAIGYIDSASVDKTVKVIYILK